MEEEKMRKAQIKWYLNFQIENPILNWEFQHSQARNGFKCFYKRNKLKLN